MEEDIKLEPEEIEIKTEELYGEEFPLEYSIDIVKTETDVDFETELTNNDEPGYNFDQVPQTSTFPRESFQKCNVGSDLMEMSESSVLYYLKKEYLILKRQHQHYRMFYNKKLEKRKKVRDVQISSIVKLSWAAKAFISLQLKALLNMKVTSKKRKMCETVITMQMKNKFRPWSYREKKLAFLIYYKDKSFYRFLQKLGIILPPVTKMKEWIKVSDYLPGLNRLNLKHLQLKVETMEKNEKFCIVSFDVLKIDKDLKYSEKLDMIEGYEDLGPIGRFNKPAEYVLVFVMRGLYTEWTLPVAYYLIRQSITTEHLKELIIVTLTHINNIGLVPKVLISRQSEFLNVQSELGVTVDKPFFNLKYKNTLRRIIFIYDVPELVESIYNELLKRNFRLNKQMISFLDVEGVYKLDKMLGVKRDIPIIDNSNKQDVPLHLLVQVCSQNMSEAIKTYFAEKRLRSSSAMSTATFIEEMSTFYDMITNTSNNQYSMDKDFQQQNLESLLETFRNLKGITNHANEHLDRPACFDGMVQTIRGLFIIISEETDASRNISNGVVNLKPLNDFLNQIKVNNNITAHKFRLWYRRQCVKMYSKSIESDIKHEKLSEFNIREFKGFGPFQRIFVNGDANLVPIVGN